MSIALGIKNPANLMIVTPEKKKAGGNSAGFMIFMAQKHDQSVNSKSAVFLPGLRVVLRVEEVFLAYLAGIFT